VQVTPKQLITFFQVVFDFQDGSFSRTQEITHFFFSSVMTQELSCNIFLSTSVLKFFKQNINVNQHYCAKTDYQTRNITNFYQTI
jgi:hypothetical protein